MKINEISENISHTSKRLRDIERKKGVKPGTPEWFKLWFSLPYLYESAEKVYNILDNVDCGPFDGGCVLVAQALQQIHGGDIVVLVNDKGIADHAAVKVGNTLVDFDGALPVKQFIKRFEDNEHTNIKSIRPIQNGDLPEAPRNNELVPQLVNALTESLLHEGYKIQLERGKDMDVLHIVDTKTNKRTEVRGKAGYETNGYDANDKLHKLLDKISKSANISELMNGEVVGINPKHPDGASAKKATTKAFNEAKDGLPVKTLKGLYHVGTMDSSKKRDGFEGAGLSVSTHPDAWKQIARGHVTGDTHSATKEGNKFLDVHSLSDAHNEQIKQWAIENGYLEQQETVTVCYYDDEMEDDLCSTFDSMADAEAEYDEELEHMDVTVDKGGIVPTDKLKKETRQNRIDSTGVLEFVLPIFAEQQGLDGVWWQDNLDVQRYSAPRGVIVPSKIKSWKFTVNESITEALDNPYPFELIGPNDSQEFSALAQTPNGVLRMDFEATDYDNFGIDFSVGKSMGKTDSGDQFRVFATVVAMMNKWISVVGIEHVEEFSFAANKEEHAADGRARLYSRFAKKLAAQLGWSLQQSSTGNNSTEFFSLQNPKPVERPAGYFDAIDDGKLGPNGEIPAYYNESVVEAEDTLTLPKISVGDEVMVGKFKNRKAEVKGFSKDDHNQPVLKTTKGDQKLFKPRISKLMDK